MDYETLANCFTGVFEHYKTQETEIFVIHDLQNDLTKFISFLKGNINNKEWHISYNGLAFDAQVTHYILDNYFLWKDLEGCEVAAIIYKYAQRCITKSNNKEFSDYPAWKMKMGQIDIFKMHHWDNAAKRSSLKWIQYSMDWQNIIDMPIHHETLIHTQTEIDTILEYCVNDVKSTKEIYNRSHSQVKLRKELTKEYDINLYSASEPRISKEIFGYFLTKKLGIPKRDLKQMRTYRETIKVSDIILPYISFTSLEFNVLLDRFKSLEVNAYNLKGSFKYAIEYKNVKTHFGLGGVHGAANKGVYEPDDDMMIMSSDVTSFYPNLAIKNQWSPGHFPKEEFCDQYEWFFNERKKIPKSDPRNYVYKIVLNSTYGLSNDENSFLYDPELTMRITLNGQLSLMMLYEMICERIPNAVPLMQNTDGLETRIPRKYVDEYMQICKEWEDITSLQLEHDTYQKVVLADVNNYIALKEGKDFKTKAIGRFVFEDLPLHKNKSFLCIRKAMYDYFIYGKDPEQSIKENKNIFDFCGGVKAKGDWKFFEEHVINGEHKRDPLQKTVRYYISNKGSKTLKIHSLDGRVAQVEAGKWLQTMFIDYIEKPFENYDINYDFYIQKAKKEIEALEPKTNQLQLF